MAVGRLRPMDGPTGNAASITFEKPGLAQLTLYKVGVSAVAVKGNAAAFTPKQIEGLFPSVMLGKGFTVIKLAVLVEVVEVHPFLTAST